MTPVLKRVDLGDIAARTAFAAFGSAVNARNPRHLPRPIAQEMALLDPASNPWLADRAVAAWLVRDGADGPVVGRMAAMGPAEETEGEACLGLYEAEDDPGVAHLLIDAGVGWLAGRGASRVLAPVDFSIFHGYRCQTGGFDAPPFIGEPRNPAYYGSHFDALGFIPLHRWESHDIDRAHAAAALAATASDYADAQALGYRFEDYNNCTTEEALHHVWSLINASYGGMPGFVALPWERFRDHYARLPLAVDRAASCFVLDPSGARVGFSIVLKDLSAALRAMRGHSSGLGVWLDRLRFLRHARGGRWPRPTRSAFPIAS
ncbi:hypothetical protein [Sphingomonas hengshuiensis]|uniref:N-acetyltransferase n=1 Tax=Sphingomonas hengshuiensis TaxID=1609977 RepID=A0A7U4LEJ9_9SPHN|nr:hypothetical protein [Sphingomonas hengshuiensis]AJP71159.1 hypothetical protein TS85_03990 [Sphingomonas hengshuiensis]